MVEPPPTPAPATIRDEPPGMHTRAEGLVRLGARIVAEFDEPGGQWITLLDPEGNEFCLQ